MCPIGGRGGTAAVSPGIYIYSRPQRASLSAQASQNVLRRLRQALRAMRQPNNTDRGAGVARGVLRGLRLAGRWYVGARGPGGAGCARGRAVGAGVRGLGGGSRTRWVGEGRRGRACAADSACRSYGGRRGPARPRGSWRCGGAQQDSLSARPARRRPLRAGASRAGGGSPCGAQGASACARRRAETRLLWRKFSTDFIWTRMQLVFTFTATRAWIY